MTLTFLSEQWKLVPSIPGLEASSAGRIRVVAHSGKMPNGGVRIYGGVPTFGVWNKEDRRFTYFLRGRNLKIAVVVCEAFHGPKPFPKAVVMHKDENSRNNRPDNLRWGTQKENLNCPGFIAYCKSRTGENSPTVKGKSNAE